MQDTERNRRRNYFIDKRFQTKFILKFCLLIVSASMLTAVLIYWVNRDNTMVAFENLRVTVRSAADFIMPIIFEIVAIVTVLVGIATIFVTLFTSHKIAGPLYRLRKGIEKVREGNLATPFNIRADDQLQLVAEEFDAMRSDLRDSVNEIKINWATTKSELFRLLNSIGDKGDMAWFENNIRTIDSAIGKFKTE